MVSRAWGSASSALSIPSTSSNVLGTQSNRRYFNRSGDDSVTTTQSSLTNQLSIVAGTTLNTATAMRRTRVRGESCWICNTSVMTTPIVEHMVHYHPGCGAQLSRSSASTEIAHCGGLIGQMYQLCPLCLERYSYEYQSFSPFFSPPASTSRNDSIERQLPPTPTTRSSIVPPVTSGEASTIRRGSVSFAPDLLYPIESTCARSERSKENEDHISFSEKYQSHPCYRQYQILMLQFDLEQNQDWIKPAHVFKAADPLGAIVSTLDNSLKHDVHEIENGIPNCGLHENGIQNNMHSSGYCYYCHYWSTNLAGPLQVQCFKLESSKNNTLGLQRLMQITKQQLSRYFLLGIFWNLLAGKSIKHQTSHMESPNQSFSDNKVLQRTMTDDGLTQYLISNGLSNIKFLYHLYVNVSKLATRQQEISTCLSGLKTAIKCIIRYCQASRQFVTHSCCQALLDVAIGRNKAEEESHYSRIQREGDTSALNELQSQVALLNVSQTISKLLIDNANVKLMENGQCDIDEDCTYPVELDDLDNRILIDSFGYKGDFGLSTKSLDIRKSDRYEDDTKPENKFDTSKGITRELTLSPDSLEIADALAAIVISNCSSANLKTWAVNLLTQYLIEIKESSVPIFSEVSHADFNQSLPEFKCKIINICSVEANEIDVENAMAICDQKIEGIFEYTPTPGTNESSLIAIVDSHKKIHVHNSTKIDVEFLKRYETFNSNWPITLDGSQLLLNQTSTSFDERIPEDEENDLVLLSSAFSTSPLCNLCWLWSTIGSETNIPCSFGIAATIENFIIIFKSTAGQWMEIETPPSRVISQTSKVTKMLNWPLNDKLRPHEKYPEKETNNADNGKDQLINIFTENECKVDEVSLVFGRSDGTVAVYAFGETNELLTVSRPGIPVVDLSWFRTHDGEQDKSNLYLIVAFQDGLILMANNEKLNFSPQVSDREEGCSIVEESCSNDGLVYSFNDAARQLSDIELSPNQLLLAGLAIGASCNVAVWHVADVFNSNNRLLEPIYLPHPTNVHSLSWSSNRGHGAILAVGQEDGGIAIWQLDTSSNGNSPKHIYLLWGHPGMVVMNLKFHPNNGDILASVSVNTKLENKDVNIVNIWSLSVGSVIQSLSWNGKSENPTTDGIDNASSSRTNVSSSNVFPTDLQLSQASKNNCLIWVDQVTLAVGFSNSKVVRLVNLPLYDSNFMVDVRMASAIRMAFLGKIEETKIFSDTKCLKHLLCNFGSFLQVQRKYENNFVNRTQDQLIYSKLMQILLVLAFELRLDRVVQGLEEWAWLSEYANSLQALLAISSSKEQKGSNSAGILCTSNL